MRLSYSKLRSFETCPRQFFYSAIKKISYVPNKYMKAGLNMHDMLYKSTFEEDWEGWITNHEIYPEYTEMCDNYIVYNKKIKEKSNNKNPLFAEHKIHDKEHDFALVIDRVDLFDKELLLSDYKTDASGSITKHDKQLLLYSYFFQRAYPQYRITHIAALYLKKKRLGKIRPIDSEEVKNTVKWMKDLKAEIESRTPVEENFEPNCSRLCNWCGFRDNGVCKEGMNAIMRQGDITEFKGDSLEF